MKSTLLSFIITCHFLFFSALPDLGAQQPNVSTVTYKITGEDTLNMKIYQPLETNGKRKPVMVFFFGGGWVHGSIAQFEPHAKYFADKGLVTVLADYRVESRQKTSPFEALKDANSAIRFLKENSEHFGIDSSKIIASGGSAGGHLAAATALTSKYNDEKDNLRISPIPAALILFNPVIDNGPGGYGFGRIGEDYPDFSPLHNVREGAPPTLIFLGTEDKLVPVITAQYYKLVMEEVGSYCDLITYEGQGHGFFNYKNREFYDKTLQETETFLKKFRFL